MTQAEVDSLFFPARGQSVARARAICKSCPVEAQCLDLALTAKIKFGMFGGLAPHERRGLKRTAKRASPAA